jgi:predicted dehydrogenase
MTASNPKMKTIRFGLIGCGMMGREFASATARWCHLTDLDVKPELVAVCNRSEGPFPWFRAHFPGVQCYTQDYREILDYPGIDAVYIAVPHHLHQEMYCAAIRAGKHLMGEKPFGIDEPACQAIMSCLSQHPQVMARCASQWVFYPAVQRIGNLLDQQAFGRILEVNTGFLHSSDLDPNKPINWKRSLEFNGVYGCLGDLGMHVCALPFRAGWKPLNVRAILSDVVKQRPDHHGRLVPCLTWDNATLLCETLDPQSGEPFPWTLRTQRISPGEKNTWYIEILGTKTSVKFSTRNPKQLQWLRFEPGAEQIWGDVHTGFETPYKTITGSIFEFGTPDAILQMWAAFLDELDRGQPRKPFAGCATPEEAALSHRLFTAALQSQQNASTVQLF